MHKSFALIALTVLALAGCGGDDKPQRLDQAEAERAVGAFAGKKVSCDDLGYSGSAAEISGSQVWLCGGGQQKDDCYTTRFNEFGSLVVLAYEEGGVADSVVECQELHADDANGAGPTQVVRDKAGDPEDGNYKRTRRSATSMFGS